MDNITDRERQLIKENDQLRHTVYGAMWVMRHIAGRSTDRDCRFMARQVVEAYRPGTYPEAGAVNGDVKSPTETPICEGEACPC